MKILLFGNANSAHIQNWAFTLKEKVNLEIVSLSSISDEQVVFFEKIGVKVHCPTKLQTIFTDPREGAYSKALALILLPWIFWRIYRSQASIVHVHYAALYGFLGALMPRMRKKWIISIWGSDMYNFPNISILHKYVFKYTVSRYHCVQLTSKFMMQEARKWIDENFVKVVPFPVDVERFKPAKYRDVCMSGPIKLGTVKTLHPKYGIDFMLKACAQVHADGYNVQIEIYGDGPDRQSLIDLAEHLGISDICKFHGRMEYTVIEKAYANLDVYMALSTDDSETFGVAVLEASSCGVPVIVSQRGGLSEVVADEETGYVVDHTNQQQIVGRLISLIKNASLRRDIGVAGRRRVESLYSTEICQGRQYDVYCEMLNIVG